MSSEPAASPNNISITDTAKSPAALPPPRSTRPTQRLSAPAKILAPNPTSPPPVRALPKTVEGRTDNEPTYYFNATTGESTFDKPQELMLTDELKEHKRFLEYKEVSEK